MSVLIVYYSHSGNTKKVAESLKAALSKKGEVQLRELKPVKESGNFFVQAAGAFAGTRAKLTDENFDLTGYDLICIGTPVWAFAPAPAINTFLDKLGDLDGKDAICFTTYGSGTGVGKCVHAIMKRLKRKNAFKMSSFNIQQSKVNNPEFVNKAIDKALADIGF